MQEQRTSSANQERVIVAPTASAAGVVVMVWTDPDETPLAAMARLNAEVIEARRGAGLSVEARDELAVAMRAVEAALDSAQTAGSYANDTRDQAEYAMSNAEEAENAADEARAAIQRIVELTEQVVS